MPTGTRRQSDSHATWRRSSPSLLRWLDLIRSLKVAASSAAALGRAADHAWALHELGSLQLAAGDPHGAAKNLQEARRIKDTLPPGNGRCATRHNLDSAQRDIYAIHARYQKLFKLTAAVIILPLLLAGGVAAAIIIDSPGPTTTSIAQKQTARQVIQAQPAQQTRQDRLARPQPADRHRRTVPNADSSTRNHTHYLDTDIRRRVRRRERRSGHRNPECQRH